LGDRFSYGTELYDDCIENFNNALSLCKRVGVVLDDDEDEEDEVEEAEASVAGAVAQTLPQ
jgi:hypothetical protein